MDWCTNLKKPELFLYMPDCLTKLILKATKTPVSNLFLLRLLFCNTHMYNVIKIIVGVILRILAAYIYVLFWKKGPYTKAPICFKIE